MEYSIQFTEKCLTEIDKICLYITEVLKAEEASRTLREKIKKSTMKLVNMPKMYSEIEKTDRLNQLYRKIAINNYVILYAIDEENRIVYISHMYYSGRNYLEIFEEE